MTAADLDECADVLYAADDDLTLSRGMPLMPHNRDALVSLFGHIQDVSPDRGWLAHIGHRVVGFGQAIGYRRSAFLSFLFVLPGQQAKGIGRALLERAMAGAEHRAVCILAIQPISAALYAQYGMVPRVPIYTFTGRAAADLPALRGGLDVRPLPYRDGVELLDRAVTRVRRPFDHDWWQAAARQPYGLYQGPTLVGYGYVQPSGRLGPVVVSDAADLAPFVGRLMTQLPQVPAWTMNVPGSAGATFVSLLRAGLRLDGPPAIYCATRQTIDHRRYLPSSFALP